jgi:hypothetical protein
MASSASTPPGPLYGLGNSSSSSSIPETPSGRPCTAAHAPCKKSVPACTHAIPILRPCLLVAVFLFGPFRPADSVQDDEGDDNDEQDEGEAYHAAPLRATRRPRTHAFATASVHRSILRGSFGRRSRSARVSSSLSWNAAPSSTSSAHRRTRTHMMSSVLKLLSRKYVEPKALTAAASLRKHGWRRSTCYVHILIPPMLPPEKTPRHAKN